MNAAQWHLTLVHVPVIGLLCALVIYAVAFCSKNELLDRLGHAFVVVCALLTVAAYYTGPSALSVLDEFVAAQGGTPIERQLVEQHAAIGKASFTAIIILGAVAAQAWIRYFQDSRPGKVLRVVLLVCALGCAYLMAWTSHLGGLIRHPEIREPQMILFPELPR